jgi:uncharacterized membrane protein (DUF4010 family)
MEYFENLDFNTELLISLRDLFLALGIGLLMGIEREFSKVQEEEHHRLFAGVRTFSIVSVLGYLSMFLEEQLGIWVFIAAFLGVIILTGISYFKANAEDQGTTTEFALNVCFLLGALVYTKSYHMAVTGAVLVTALLGFKIKIHAFVGRLDLKEISAILIFIITTALVLPLLPNQDIGPYGIFNLYKIWLIVAIFMALNFIAYFLSKFFDQKNSVLLTGIIGGFASSTATSWFFSRKSGRSEKGGILETAAIVFASSIMFPRLLIWLVILNFELLKILWLPLVIISIIGIGAGYWITRKDTGTTEQAPAKGSPINFKEAFFFAAIYVVIKLLVAYTDDEFGDTGVWIAAGISGLTDIDAITISMANFGKLKIAAIAILIGAFSNTLVKYAFCLIFGNSNMKKYSSWVFIPLFLLGTGLIVYEILTL